VYHPPRTSMADPQTWHAYEWSSLARWTTWVLRTSRWTVVATLDAGPGSTASGPGRSWLISLNRQMEKPDFPWACQYSSASSYARLASLLDGRPEAIDL
jgi:hypothetical protein